MVIIILYKYYQYVKLTLIKRIFSFVLKNYRSFPKITLPIQHTLTTPPLLKHANHFSFNINSDIGHEVSLYNIFIISTFKSTL